MNASSILILIISMIDGWSVWCLYFYMIDLIVHFKNILVVSTVQFHNTSDSVSAYSDHIQFRIISANRQRKKYVSIKIDIKWSKDYVLSFICTDEFILFAKILE